MAAFQILNSLCIICFGHNLDLAIKKGLSNRPVKHAIARCHSLIKLFHRNFKKSRDSRDKQQVFDLSQHNLVRDVRSNSLGINISYDIPYTRVAASHYQKCGHRIVCSIRVFKMDFHVIKLSIVAYP